MTRLRDLDLTQHLADPARKQRFVTPMFDLVAPRYDAFTRAFSFGMDARWKRALIGEVAWRVPQGARALDLACGTGDLAFAVVAAVGGARVTGVDASARMLDVARARARDAADGRVDFRHGDLGALAEPAASVDLVTAGYAFRNVPDHRAALTEAARVLRRGGILATLDLYRPDGAAWRALFVGWLRLSGNLFGWSWHREPVAYGYIAPSIAAFVSADTFTSDLERAGFDVLLARRYLGGGAAIHVARKR